MLYDSLVFVRALMLVETVVQSISINYSRRFLGTGLFDISKFDLQDWPYLGMIFFCIFGSFGGPLKNSCVHFFKILIKQDIQISAHRLFYIKVFRKCKNENTEKRYLKTLQYTHVALAINIFKISCLILSEGFD